MSSLVLDLQQELLQPNCNVINALRKAHLIAAKLKLTEFDAWVLSELNGYSCSEADTPEYRKVRGQLKALNPYQGWIPAQINDEELERIICERALTQSLVELQELYDKTSNHAFQIQFSGSQMESISSLFRTPIPMEYALHVSTYILKSIAEKVQNCLLDWTIRLESEGILGENMRFTQDENEAAKTVPQQINHYYGTFIIGDVKDSQVTSGNKNTPSFK